MSGVIFFVSTNMLFSAICSLICFATRFMSERGTCTAVLTPVPHRVHGTAPSFCCEAYNRPCRSSAGGRTAQL